MKQRIGIERNTESKIIGFCIPDGDCPERCEDCNKLIERYGKPDNATTHFVSQSTLKILNNPNLCIEEVLAQLNGIVN